jgi:hypothetical protein
VRYLLGLLSSTLFLGAIVRTVLRGVMRLRYSILWLVLGIGVLTIAVAPNLLEIFANFFDIAIPLNLLFFFALTIMGFVIFMISSENSFLQIKLVDLVSKVALLEQQVNSLSQIVEKKKN